jgi:hypothetical protein
MPSPFPGMNPYFEQPGEWRGFHSLFLSQLDFAIMRTIAPGYVVKVEESLTIDINRDDDAHPRRRPKLIVADVALRRGSRSTGGAAVAELPTSNRLRSIVARLPDFIRVPHRWLTIRDLKGKKVVAVIEVLSPSNKLPGKDRGAYLDKREAIFSSDAHFVEIDLLRGGEPMPFEGCPASDYRIAVSRVLQRPTVEIWPFGLRDPIPIVPVPLKAGDPELPIDLKAVLDSVYDGGRSELTIYEDPPEPPLSRRDAAWAKKLLTSASSS